MAPHLLPLLLLAAVPTAPGATLAQDTAPQVRAVLFHSPACPHCRTVLARDIPPLEARWGSSLSVLRVDVTTVEGGSLYRSAVRSLAIPDDRLGVPTLVVGDQVLVGSGEIPARLPGLVAAGVEAGGIPWPGVEGLEAYVISREREAVQGPGGGVGQGGDPVRPEGLLLGWGVFIVLLGTLVGGVGATRTPPTGGAGRGPPGPVHRSATGLLFAVGLGTAGYLSTTALTSSETACGPVGNCAAVHASAFSRLLGLPVAAWGVAFYFVLAALWLASRTDPRRSAGLLWLALLGVAFSAYLTAMELLVVRAVCLWCLGSALAAAGLFWLAVVGHRPNPRSLQGGTIRRRPG